MVVAHIGASGLSLEIDRRARVQGESRASDVDSCQSARDHLVAHHLALVNTDFILNENWKYCDNELKQTLPLLHTVNGVKRSRPCSKLFIVSKPTDKKSSTFMRRNMRWEAPSMPTAAYDPRLLPEQDTPLMIGKTWFLDQEIPVGGFVRIQDSYGNSEWTKRELSRRKV